MNALRNLGVNSADLERSITRLSTGLRINSAADDPAGLIASESFRAQIAGIDQAVRNSQDAINYAKTAEGALRRPIDLQVVNEYRGAISALNSGAPVMMTKADSPLGRSLHDVARAIDKAAGAALTTAPAR